mmetsp:Transcript_14094/g.44359  ORF Transcript_14094/g.44359 Transcript_14094/m.44359 type:complete len:209 (+) Transcript_14094:798-1424(+)
MRGKRTRARTSRKRLRQSQERRLRHRPARQHRQRRLPQRRRRRRPRLRRPHGHEPCRSPRCWNTREGQSDLRRSVRPFESRWQSGRTDLPPRPTVARTTVAPDQLCRRRRRRRRRRPQLPRPLASAAAGLHPGPRLPRPLQHRVARGGWLATRRRTRRRISLLLGRLEDVRRPPPRLPRAGRPPGKHRRRRPRRCCHCLASAHAAVAS